MPRGKKCPECGKPYIHFDLHWNICPKNTEVTDNDVAQDGSANTEASRELAQSNPKSEDTLACGYCGMPMTSARHLTLHIGMAHPPIKAILPEPPQDTCGCLCHNPDALKWGCEHCAMPPQYTTIQDVVNGTPKGQEAVQKAIDDSIKVQNEMTKKAQDTSLDELHQIFGTRGMTQEMLKEAIMAWHKAERANLFEQIRSEAELYNVKSINGEIVKPNTGILAVPLEALTRLEAKQ